MHERHSLVPDLSLPKNVERMKPYNGRVERKIAARVKPLRLEVQAAHCTEHLDAEQRQHVEIRGLWLTEDTNA